MTCITRQRVGKYTYLYESTSFRDENGKVQNIKNRIGKIHPTTGETIYDKEYLQRLKDTKEKKSDDLNGNFTMSNDEIKEISSEEKKQIENILDGTRYFGSFYLFKSLAEEISLLSTLEKIFPEIYKQIFVLACFLVETQEPLMYCKEWQENTVTFPDINIMNSQYISRLFSTITEAQKNDFLEIWMQNVQKTDYIALDITSISSYSELIESCEWGYNRDKEKLPQINLCLLFAEGCKYPIFFKDYAGSLNDVSTLKSTITEIKELINNASLCIVMDKGFFSIDNVNMMLDKKNNVKFIISVPFSTSFAKKLIEKERKTIDNVSNTVLTADVPIRGVHKVEKWNYKKTKNEVHTHIYYNPLKALKDRNELYTYITELKYELIKDPNNKELKREFEKFFTIVPSTEENEEYIINIREDVIESKLKTSGWMVLISNHIDDVNKAIEVYRSKDVVEKGFNRFKNSLDFKRLRVHTDKMMKNKLFISFISLILLSVLHKKMKKSGLYKRYTMHELILKLRKIKMTYVRKTKILQPITKEQREILDELSISLT